MTLNTSNKKRSKVNRPAPPIYWCMNCNIPLITSRCGLCSKQTKQINLGLPGDVRFCSPYERSILHDILITEYGTDPLESRLILLNKIGGDDKTDQVIVDGLFLGILHFNLAILDWKLDLNIEGAAILAQYTGRRTIELSEAGRHLSGKTIPSDMIRQCSKDIRPGDEVIVKYARLVGVGTALLGENEITKINNNNNKNNDNKNNNTNKAPALRIRKIKKTGPQSQLIERIATMDEVIQANRPALEQLSRDCVNTIRGLANQKQYNQTPIYVSFSGGKDSLVVLDLARSALKHTPAAYFINTGLEFPDNPEYVKRVCKDMDIELFEIKAGNAFLENIEKLGPPTKDCRWCCNVCKLVPINHEHDGKPHLNLDGKRRFESFTRSRIPPKEENPLVPGQVNIYPIRNWRAIEVWLYIYWKELEYNSLYDKGFERVGCWLCPAALIAEHCLVKQIYPELYSRWDKYLHNWALDNNLPKGYIEYGFWRWREHPPKMKLLAEQLGIPLRI
ncbi:MAG: phosphoadenosine phosphosulfate reductase family protein [Methanosarcinales archaeon]|nr:phosphoadenosine phosphosulfate reductase family protein [Methanosarcinales archaeon]